jgi:hypothetical protein
MAGDRSVQSVVSGPRRRFSVRVCNGGALAAVLAAAGVLLAGAVGAAPGPDGRGPRATGPSSVYTEQTPCGAFDCDPAASLCSGQCAEQTPCAHYACDGNLAPPADACYNTTSGAAAHSLRPRWILLLTGWAAPADSAKIGGCGED